MNMYRRRAAPVVDAGAADAQSVETPVAGPSNSNLAETATPEAPKRKVSRFVHLFHAARPDVEL